MTDPLTRAGAGVLARTVNAYWHRRGYPQVQAEPYELGEPFEGNWGVRSNLVAGLPPHPTR